MVRLPRAGVFVGALFGAALIAYAFGFLLVQWAGHRFATIVRCQVLCAKGHVFEAAWVVAARMPGVRVLRRRMMYCPVGKHRTWCAPIEPDIRARVGSQAGFETLNPTSPPHGS